MDWDEQTKMKSRTKEILVREQLGRKRVAAWL